MGFEVAIYDNERKVVVHSLKCKIHSTVPREYQVGNVVRVSEGWIAKPCLICQPTFHTVLLVRRHIRVDEDVGVQESPRWEGYGAHSETERNREAANKAYWDRGINRNNPDSSYPPYGIVALDITHSENRKKWWDDANCRSDDERLGPWLEWLYMGEHVEHWTLTVQKVVCCECPVRTECLEQGVWGNETWGVWGGANQRERQQLRWKWLREGRIDERPNRPRNPGLYVRGKDGSRVAAQSRNDSVQVDETPREGTTTSEEVSPVSFTDKREVRWPGAHVVTGDGWEGNSPGDR